MSFIALACLSLFAQKAVENKISYRLTERPSVRFDSSAQTYAIRIRIEDQKWGIKNGPLLQSYEEEIYNAIDIPLAQLSETDSEADFTISIDFGQLLNLTWEKKDPNLINKYYYIGKLSIPISATYNFKQDPMQDYTREYTYQLDDRGKYNYESKRFEETSEDNKFKALEAAAKIYLEGLVRSFKGENTRYYSSIQRASISIYTIKDKKIDYPNIKMAYELSAKGISLIKEADYYPNSEAEEVIDQAIAKYDEIISNMEFKKKQVTFYIYQNKFQLELLNGNFTAAIETRKDIKKNIGGIYTMTLRTIELIESDKRMAEYLGYPAK